MSGVIAYPRRKRPRIGPPREFIARSILLTVLMFAALIVTGTPAADAQELTFSVAVSMKEATEELGRSFTQARPGVLLRYNFGSSGELQKQIEAGAPVDLFISAAQRQMDELEHKVLIVAATRRVFARNVLTVVRPTDSRLDLAKPADLLDPRLTKVVIGNPRTVPAGQYAEECLRALGLWDRLQSKLVYSENVRQALDYVARGEVDAGFVYTTDAAVRSKNVTEAFRPPEDTYRPVTYPVAVVKDARQPILARAFIDLLMSPEGQQVLARLGFQPPPPGAR
jgi:molybdate transport system substrate-binding protein